MTAVRVVRRGERITLPATQGEGFVRRAAPEDGLYFEDRERVLFVPRSELELVREPLLAWMRAGLPQRTRK